MIRISNEKELLDLFRPIDRDEVQIPALMKFPFGLRGTFSWMEPSGYRVYLIFRDPTNDRPVGVVFQKTHAVGEMTNRMCDWCHSVGSGDSVSLLTATASKTRKVGAVLCSDLTCLDKVGDVPGIHDLRETLSREEKSYRVLKRMSDFIRKNLI